MVNLKKISLNGNNQAAGGMAMGPTQPNIPSATGVWNPIYNNNSGIMGWTPTTGSSNNYSNTSVSSNIGSNDVSKLQQNPNMPGWLAQLMKLLQGGRY